jgi:hypothetical protein
MSRRSGRRAGKAPARPAPPADRSRDERQRAEQISEDGDFAEEHREATFAYELPDGPERATDPDSPTGLAGADPGTT